MDAIRNERVLILVTVFNWTYDAIETTLKAMITKQKRPKFLNLLRIHLPVTGVNSFAHRVSGALLFLAIPVFIYGFSLSVKDATSFNALLVDLKTVPYKLLFTVLAWALGHHLLAGVRFLLHEIEIGTSLSASKIASWLVNILGVIIFLVVGSCIWL